MKLPRFSLRTLFVLVALVSIPLGWVAYHLRWISDRHRLRQWSRNHHVEYHYPDGEASQPFWALRLFREEGLPEMQIGLNSKNDDETIKEFKKVFPECKVVIVRGGDNNWKITDE